MAENPDGIVPDREVIIEALRAIFAAQIDPRLDWKLKDKRDEIRRHLRDCETCGPAYARASRKGLIPPPEKMCKTGRGLLESFGEIARSFS